MKSTGFEQQARDALAAAGQPIEGLLTFPVELRSLPQWVSWALVPDPKAPKPRKMPYSPTTRKPASTTDPLTWGTFDEAVGAWSADPSLAGIGFVFGADDPYCGIDLDHCIDPSSGQITAVDIGLGRTLDPARILKHLASYTELSPSGTGLHVIVKASLAALTGRKRGGFECYDQARFFTVTGRRWPNTPATVEARQAELEALHTWVWPPEPKNKGNGQTRPAGCASIDDIDLLDKARAAENGAKFSALYDRGDWQGQGFPSQSEADLALCCALAFWTDRDVERIDRLFRQSALSREKWDSRRGAITLGGRTIAKAIEQTSEGYRPPRSASQAPPTERELPPISVYEQNLARSAPTTAKPKRTPDLEHAFIETACAADVSPQPIRWLWPGRIALGKLSVVAGDPGLGKSMMSVALAAHVTHGTPWPVDRTECPQGSVLLISAEDDLADTIRPRLDAVGADVTRVHLLTAVREPDPETGKLNARGLSLKRDIQALERKLLELKDCKLVVIDPVTAYLDGTDSHNNADVRGLLAPLADLAHRHGSAVIAVTHLNKGGGQSAMYRATGSLAFVAAARAVFVVTKDRDIDGRRLVLPVKNNLGNDQTGVAYRIESTADNVPYIAWEDGAVSTGADEALAPALPDDERTERDEAADWLRDVLADGPLPAKDIKKLAGQAGVAWRTIERSKHKAGVVVEKMGFTAGWRWVLRSPPPEDRHTPATPTHGGLGGLGGLPKESTGYRDGFNGVLPKNAKTATVGMAGNLGGLRDEVTTTAADDWEDVE